MGEYLRKFLCNEGGTKLNIQLEMGTIGLQLIDLKVKKFPDSIPDVVVGQDFWKNQNWDETAELKWLFKINQSRILNFEFDSLYNIKIVVTFKRKLTRHHLVINFMLFYYFSNNQSLLIKMECDH